MNVRLEGMSKAAQIPGWLEEGQREFVDETGKRLRDSIRSKAPGGDHGEIARSVVYVVINSRRVMIFSLHPGAKAQERGAWIKPRHPGGAIRFEMEGREIFLRGGVRIPATRFATKGLRPRSRIVRETFAEKMSHLERFGTGATA